MASDHQRKSEHSIGQLWLKDGSRTAGVGSAPWVAEFCDRSFAGIGVDKACDQAQYRSLYPDEARVAKRYPVLLDRPSRLPTHEAAKLSPFALN